MRFVSFFLLGLAFCSLSAYAQTAKLSFEYEVLADANSDEGPQTKLYVVLNGKKAEAPVFYMELKDGPYQSGAPNVIPKGALAICGGFWAGLQLDLYIMLKKGVYVLYEAAQDESTKRGKPVVRKVQTFQASDFK